MNKLTPKQKVRRAFDTIYDNHVFFSSFVMSWNVVADDSIKTAATDGPSVWYSPAFIERCEVADTFDVMLHESGHISFGHHLRFENLSADLWNEAADLALNDKFKPLYHADGMVRKIGLFPGEGKYIDYPVGKDAEFYYAMCKKDESADKAKGGDGSGRGKGVGKGGSEKGKGTGDGQGEGEGEGEGFNLGKILPHPSIANGTEEEIAEVEKEWEKQVARAVNTAIMQGNLPGWMQELGDQLLKRKQTVNWKAYLRKFLTQYCKVGQDYQRPSRRHAHRQAESSIIMPNKRSKEAAPFAVLADVSGSMSIKMMNYGPSEITNIMQAYTHCEVDLMQCDTRLIKEATIHYNRWNMPIKIPPTWHGRGGTDLTGAILEIGKMRKYKSLVVLTDGEWTQMATCPNPGIPVLWLMTRPVRYKPKFGMVVHIDEAA